MKNLQNTIQISSIAAKIILHSSTTPRRARRAKKVKGQDYIHPAQALILHNVLSKHVEYDKSLLKINWTNSTNREHIANFQPTAVEILRTLISDDERAAFDQAFPSLVNDAIVSLNHEHDQQYVPFPIIRRTKGSKYCVVGHRGFLSKKDLAIYAIELLYSYKGKGADGKNGYMEKIEGSNREFLADLVRASGSELLPEDSNDFYITTTLGHDARYPFNPRIGERMPNLGFYVFKDGLMHTFYISNLVADVNGILLGNLELPEFAYCSDEQLQQRKELNKEAYQRAKKRREWLSEKPKVTADQKLTFDASNYELEFDEWLAA